MLKEITSVYVPIQTPDHKVWATALAVLVHIGVLGFIIYTNHAKPLNEPPIQMSLVTPEQLAAIQGQAQANQQAANAKNNAMTMAMTMATTTTQATPSNPAIAAYNNDLAARQAKWQREQAAYAAQIDEQAKQDTAQFNNQIKQVQMAQNAQLNNLKNIENNPAPTVPLTPTTKAKTPPSQRITYTDDGTGKATNASPTAGGMSDGTLGGSSDTGMSRGDYKAEVARKIYANWQTAAGDKGKQIRARFDISTSGEITNIVVEGADSPLKNALYQAIQSATLSPPPPKHYASFAHNTSTFRVP